MAVSEAWRDVPGYDAIQTNIRVNHLALVAVARAGDDARLNMDSQDTMNAIKIMHIKIQTIKESSMALF